MTEHRYGSHTVSRLTAHLVWITKYRYDVLRGDIQVRCRELIVQVCDAEDVRILKGVVSKNHVHMRTQGAGTADAQASTPAPFALAGEAFTAWFNDRVRRLTSPTVMLGTKLARVVGLLPDGRLMVEVETEALEPERQAVAFEATYLDQLVRKIAAISL